MNYDLKLTHTGGSDTMIYHSFTRNFALLVTAWSIRSELAMNEKQGSTTTEMTSQITELETWMNYDLKLTHTGGSDTMIYHSFSRNFAMLVTAWSIRSELAMSEKQGSATTGMTAKSVNWSHEWIMIWSSPTQVVLTLWSTTHFHAILPCLSPPDPYGAN